MGYTATENSSNVEIRSERFKNYRGRRCTYFFHDDDIYTWKEHFAKMATTNHYYQTALIQSQVDNLAYFTVNGVIYTKDKLEDTCLQSWKQRGETPPRDIVVELFDANHKQI